MKTVRLEEKGFTLIELLVVVSIIGLLSTLAITSMSSARNKAKSVSFQATAKTVQAALVMCCSAVGTSLQSSSGDPIAGGSTCYNSSTHTSLTDYPSYPGDKSVGTINVSQDCTDGAFTVVIQPGTDSVGGWARATCYNDRCDFSNT